MSRQQAYKKLLADKIFEVIDRLGNSPDLSPIKNCWNYMKEKLVQGHGSLPKLIQEIKLLWTWISPMRTLRIWVILL